MLAANSVNLSDPAAETGSVAASRPNPLKLVKLWESRTIKSFYHRLTSPGAELDRSLHDEEVQSFHSSLPAACVTENLSNP